MNIGLHFCRVSQVLLNHDFFSCSRFLLVKEHLVEFNQLAMAKAQGCEDMLNRVMTKDNIGLGLLLETREECYGAICKNLSG